jgi:hypothetical protein
MGDRVGQKRHYRAFISYSHADLKVAQWLHRALERYRLPPRLVGEQTAVGTVPARLAPIFRDRDELPAAGNLTEELCAALLDSDFLIVVASPAAAESRWVNEEVRLFKQMHGEARVLALIADDNPGERGSADAFPPALRFHVDAQGAITDQPVEPIAADIRSGKDGKRLAKLKLVAGLTGLPLDDLVQRESARRQGWLMGIASASLALVAAMTVLTVAAIQGQREAERQQAHADGLIEFMLTDLRKKLEPVARLDTLDAVGQRAMVYYAGQNPARLDADALGRRARALMLVGEVRDLRGNGEGALVAYQEAERTTAELLDRDPHNPDRMFDHAQSLFYVGQLAWQRKDWDAAEDRFHRYVTLADRMLATDPANPKWQAEVGYAANGLGAVLLSRRQPDAARAQFERYVAVTGQLAAARPDDTEAAWEHSQARAWLADAYLQAGRLADARTERMAELAILSGLSAADAHDGNVRAALAGAQHALSKIALAEGSLPIAGKRARIAFESMHALLEQDPANSLRREMATSAANTHAESLLLQQRWAEAVAANDWAKDNARRLVATDPQNQRWRIGLLMPARWMEIAILFGQRHPADARAAIARFHADFGPTRSTDVAIGAASAWSALALLEAADLAAQGREKEALAVAATGSAVETPAPDALQVASRAQLAAITDGRWPAPIAEGSYPAHILAQAARP